MVVEQTVSVFELKQIILGKVFESQANCPRVGLMTNSNSFYTLEYICQQGKRARYHLWLRPRAYLSIPEWKTTSQSYLNSTWPFPCSRWSALTRASKMWRQRLILVHTSTDSFIALIVSTVLRSFDRTEAVNLWIDPQSRSERFQMDSEGTSRFLPQLLLKVFASNIAKARQARLSKSWRFVFKWRLISWTVVGKVISHSYPEGVWSATNTLPKGQV